MLTRILVIRERLADLARRLPDHIGAFEQDQVDEVKGAFERAKKVLLNEPSQRKDLTLFGLIMVFASLRHGSSFASPPGALKPTRSHASPAAAMRGRSISC